jgi:hypothetical protein
MRGYHEGFNLYNKDVYARIGFYLRIECPGSIPPFFGLGISFHTDTVEDQVSSITCGYFLWNRPGTVAAFGYLLVHAVALQFSHRRTFWKIRERANYAGNISSNLNLFALTFLP